MPATSARRRRPRALPFTVRWRRWSSVRRTGLGAYAARRTRFASWFRDSRQAFGRLAPIAGRPLYEMTVRELRTLEFSIQSGPFDALVAASRFLGSSIVRAYR